MRLTTWWLRARLGGAMLPRSRHLLLSELVMTLLVHVCGLPCCVHTVCAAQACAIHRRRCRWHAWVTGPRSAARPWVKGAQGAGRVPRPPEGGGERAGHSAPFRTVHTRHVHAHASRRFVVVWMFSLDRVLIGSGATQPQFGTCGGAAAWRLSTHQWTRPPMVLLHGATSSSG